MIILVSLSITSLFWWESTQNTLLLTDNKKLLIDTVRKTLKAQLDEKVASYPHSSADLDKIWQSRQSRFYLSDNGQPLYPFPFLGTTSTKLSEQWQAFENIIDNTPYDKLNNKLSTKLSTAELQRIKALKAIGTAIKQGDNALINTSVQAYFTQVQSYQLSPLVETISALMFLTIDPKNQWNSALTEKIVLSGSSLFKPISFYLLRDNIDFTKADLLKSTTLLKAILEKSNISSTWLAFNVEQMLSARISKPVSLLGANNNAVIINNQWLSVQLNQAINLIVPFNIENELTLAVNSLKKQGVLSILDQVTTDKKSELETFTSLQTLALNLQKPAWHKLANEQYYFYLFKLVLLLIFTFALLTVSYLLINQQKKKQQYIAMREDFLNLVSHELKTPLAAIRVMAETIEKRKMKSMPLKDYPARIVSEADNLTLMIENLLSMNQLKTEQLTLNKQPVYLANLIKHCLEKFHHNVDKPFKAVINVSEQTQCFVDETLFELVIVNLIANAIKYNDKTAIDLSFKVAQSQLFIQDNSCGIAQPMWPVVFEEFKRLPQQKAINGNGLGLAICKRILHLHQADITIVSSNNNGTCWQISCQLLKDKEHG
ncbi:MAG: sensor histidine kinase [Thalassotalea sp.]